MAISMPSKVFREKQQVHELIERLAPNQIIAVRRLLEAMLDPAARTIAAAPPDDEPITDEDRRRFCDGQAWLAQHGGKGIPMEEILAEFGIKAGDIARAK